MLVVRKRATEVHKNRCLLSLEVLVYTDLQVSSSKGCRFHLSAMPYSSVPFRCTVYPSKLGEAGCPPAGHGGPRWSRDPSAACEGTHTEADGYSLKETEHEKSMKRKAQQRRCSGLTTTHIPHPLVLFREEDRKVRCEADHGKK